MLGQALRSTTHTYSCIVTKANGSYSRFEITGGIKVNELEKRIDEFYQEADGYLKEAAKQLKLVTDPAAVFIEKIDGVTTYLKASDKLQSIIDELYPIKKLLKQAEMMENIKKNLEV